MAYTASTDVLGVLHKSCFKICVVVHIEAPDMTYICSRSEGQLRLHSQC